MTTTLLFSFSQVVAPLCVEGAINGQIVTACVDPHLARPQRLGDVAVMDSYVEDLAAVFESLSVVRCALAMWR